MRGRPRKKRVLQKHFCQKCGKELSRLELNESVLDASYVVIMQNTLHKIVPTYYGRRDGAPEVYYTGSTKRKVAYTVCHECAEHIAAYLAPLMPLPSIMEEESENESQV